MNFDITTNPGNAMITSELMEGFKDMTVHNIRVMSHLTGQRL